jgi:NAD(P)-dependent dehydrogenase (short-subunit alcohol dehydrogenase family)
MASMNEKVVLVTGGSGGIGAATAAHIVAEGGRVVLFDLDGDALARAAAPLGDAAAVFAGDVTRLTDQQAAVTLATERFGGLHAVFANAGIEGRLAPLTEQSWEDFERVLHVNVLGAWNSIRASVPALVAAGGGSIVINSSVAGFMGSPGLGPYVTSKHAVIGLMRTAAAELAGAGIRVNSVHPGPIENRMMRSIEEMASPGHGADVKAGFLGMIPMARYGTNDEIAALATFLLSPAASYCHGQTFVADGGLLAT